MSVTSQAIIITNPLPKELIALKEELIQERDMIAAQIDTLVITDEASLIKGELLYKDLRAFTKRVAEGRLEITRPIDDLKKQIMAAEATATQPLYERETVLAKKCNEFRKELERIAKEAAEKERKEAEEEAERKRIAAEAERARELKEFSEKRAALAKQREEEKALFGEAVTEVVEITPPPVVVPVVEIPAPRSVAPILPRSTVRETTRKVTVITDEALLIAEACKDGGKIHGKQVLIIDSKAVDQLIKAGCAVAGAKLETKTTYGSNG